MKTRLLLANDTHGVYFEVGEKRLAQQYRKAHPAYHGRHIRSVIHFWDGKDARLNSGKEFEFWV
jgi:hypothetical protein